jgi:hypothetical protein
VVQGKVFPEGKVLHVISKEILKIKAGKKDHQDLEEGIHPKILKETALKTNEEVKDQKVMGEIAILQKILKAERQVTGTKDGENIKKLIQVTGISKGDMEKVPATVNLEKSRVKEKNLR